mgnify:CR=1 FL=1
MNVIGYARVSTSDQAENGFSLKLQEDAIVKYCKNNGYNLIEVHKEDFSGKNDFNRPKWNQIINYIKKNKNTVNRRVHIHLSFFRYLLLALNQLP